jgi:hypothetical protein
VRDTGKAWLTALGTSLSIGTDPQHHQPRVDFPQCLETDPPLFECSGSEVLKHHVRLRDALFEQRCALRLAQIQSNGFLVACLTQPDEAVAALSNRAEPA